MDQIINIVQVALGIGLVIFVHEAGHFLAARWCGVKVHVFSLGFGPKLFGWERGGTHYQIAAVPLGGYVSMAGEEPVEGRPPRSDELPAKSVPQRFLIYSGGVIMNMIFALVVFPIVLMVGVPFDQPVIGEVIPGSAAWHAGLEPGTTIENVNGDSVYAFIHIPNAVALGSPKETTLRVRDSGATESRSLSMVPDINQDLGLTTIGIVGPPIHEDHRVVVFKESSASAAGVRTGDRLVDVKSGDGALLKELRLSQRLASSYASGGPLTVEFERDADGSLYTVELAPEDPDKKSRKLMGVAPAARIIGAVRKNERTRDLDILEGDEIVSVGGRKTYDGTGFKLALVDALAESAGSDSGVELLLKRSEDSEVGARIEHSVTLPREWNREQILAFASDLALDRDPTSTEIFVTKGSAAAAAGLRSGDHMTTMNGDPVRSFEEITTKSRAAAKSGDPIAVAIERASAYGDPEVVKATIALKPAPSGYGFGLEPASYIYKTPSPLEAIRVGSISSWRFLQDTWRTLKGMVLGNVDTKNIGGIITIAVAADQFAKTGLSKLFFFLCLLSVNLAFLNVLPIPVLDGGHLLFLLVEAIKGSPVSTKIMSYSQLVGLVLIVSLMIYVLHNDVVRWILPPS